MNLSPHKILRSKCKTRAVVSPVCAGRNKPCKSASGVALVLVLAFLVLITGLVLAFFSSVSTELSGATGYANETTTKQLADSTVQAAVGAIRQATSGSSSIAWASQPGMIRNYDSSGNPTAFYKLYSSANMVVAGPSLASFDPASDLDPQWNQKPAMYTDINSPVTSGTSVVFPIIDGNAVQSLTKTPSGTTVPPYLGYYSGTNGLPDVDGFSIDPSKVTYSGTQPLSGTNTPVPMPVRWIYVLKDGSLTAPTHVDSTTGKIADWIGSATPPSSANPIVGRVAFWTDDETCKININTASEGVYWDTPRVKSTQDDIFKVNQPVNHEYQRYPGHPAMTSLSTVIKHPSSWVGSGSSVPTFTGGSANSVSFTLCSPAQWIEFQWAQKLYGITPRIGAGGSNAGAIQTAMGAAVPSVTLNANRMYTNVDELAFQPVSSGSGVRVENNAILTGTGSSTVLNNATLSRERFFLTANSRAPDVNLFGKPRVSIWPITLDKATGNPVMTPYDKLIAFCTTMRNDLGATGAYRYYFERQDPNSTKTDLPQIPALTGVSRNRMLMEYLRALTNKPIPGFGGNFGAKYGADNDQILTEIFDYIRCTNLRDAQQVNFANESLSTSYTRGIPFTNWWYSTPAQATNGEGQVVPIVDLNTSTRGFGRFPTVQGASVLFIGQVDGDDPLVPRDPTTHVSVPPYPASTSQVDPATGKPLPIYTSGTISMPAVAPGNMRIQAIFLPQFFCPAEGAVWMRSNFQWSVDLTPLAVNSNALSFPNNVAGSQYLQNKLPLDETGFGDQFGLRQPVQAAGAGLVSASVDVPKGSFTFGGKATIKIWATAPSNSPGTSSTLLQTVVLNFNGPVCPVPGLAYDHVANKNGIGAGNYDKPNSGGAVNGIYFVNYRCFSSSITASGRYNATNPDSPIVQSSNPATPDLNANEGGRLQGLLSTVGAQGFIIPPDAIRSVRVISGDTRLIAAQETPAANLFEANPTTDKLRGAHNFWTGYGHPYYGAAVGRLVQGLAYAGATDSASGWSSQNEQLSTDFPSPVFGLDHFSPASDIPLNGVEVGSSSSIGTGIPGDWDNAPFANRDGPFINKADEGDTGSVSAEPYYWKIKAAAGGVVASSQFSPNRQIPSAVTFGSLPTGVLANRPWQTLLFRPQPGHPGSKDYAGNGSQSTGMPADHLFLDLFHMPVVEPYPISEPLSTAGRINMNYQIVPFTYINRDTGIRALLKSEKVISIKDSQVGAYKYFKYTSPTQAGIRMDVNIDETLKGFTNRFNNKDIFRSASEICENYIVPIDAGNSNATYSTMAAYWSDSTNTYGRRLTGDNSKERIYATLYPRLTTKSNTFTVHFRVQTLKQVPRGSSGNWATFAENKDLVTSEYRGSQIIERYADASDTTLPDFANPANYSYSLDSYPDATGKMVSAYKFRVLNTKKFAP